MIKRKVKCRNMQLPSEAISERRTAISLRRGYFGLLYQILLIASICYLLLTQVFLLTQAQGNGMLPTIKDGDLLIAFRLQQKYVKDDVVIYSADGQQRVGRIAAKETDIITMDDTGALLVNGTVQHNEFFFPSYTKDTISYPYIVPAGHVFILVNNQTHMNDSQSYGTIPIEDVSGKVISILRRRNI